MEVHAEDSSQSSGRAPLVVYTIVARERDGRKFWVRIGTAFVNRDSSLNVRLDATPTNGQLHIRDSDPSERGGDRGGDRGGRRGADGFTEVVS